MVMTVAESHSFRHRMLGHHYANMVINRQENPCGGSFSALLPHKVLN